MKESAAGEAQDHHIVLIWLNDPDNEQARWDIIGRFGSCISIPGVPTLHAGTSPPGER